MRTANLLDVRPMALHVSQARPRVCRAASGPCEVQKVEGMRGQENGGMKPPNPDDFSMRHQLRHRAETALRQTPAGVPDAAESNPGRLLHELHRTTP